MVGGDGDDSYVVDHKADAVIEDVGKGTDKVLASISYRLPANVENLKLLNAGGAINGIGNSLRNVIDGNASDNTLDGGGGVDTLRGGPGNDTYYVDSIDIVEELAAQGHDAVFSSIAYELPPNVEDLWLTGSATIGIGNGLINELHGNDMDNELDGAGAADTMSGGRGNDTYIADSGGDTIIELAGEGVDEVRSSANYVLPASSEVENLRLLGNAVAGTGNDLDNELYGNDEANTLDGGRGADTMTGGIGNDTYHVDSIDDQVVEFGGQSIQGTADQVLSSVDYELPANVENLSLIGTAINGTGNDRPNFILGNGQNNVLIGGTGTDTLDGAAGPDRLIGGTEDDDYYVDSAGDIVVELAGEGWDEVFSSVNYTLPSNAEVEVLRLIGNAVKGTGNLFDNELHGNGQDNILDGGRGDDTMFGGNGSDTYYVDRTGDVVLEGPAAGPADWVFSSVSYRVPVNVEYLSLTGNAFRGTGNGDDNNIFGNGRDNDLTGGGGEDLLDGGGGNDRMEGGTENDRYYVDSAGDSVIEFAGQGLDHVYSSIDHLLAANVEDLDLVGNARFGTGNDLDNYISGTSGANVLSGGDGADWLFGRAGGDTLTGGIGMDRFVFEPGEGPDTITDFISGTDKIAFRDFPMAGINFVQGPAATSASQTVIFDPLTHRLLWDADGTGPGAAQLLATLTGVSTMNVNDFLII